MTTPITKTPTNTTTITTNFYPKLKYSIILIVFIILVGLFLAYNPYGLANKYMGMTTFITIFVSVFFISMLIWVSISYRPTNVLMGTGTNEKKTGPIDYFKQSAIILGCLGISTTLIWAAFYIAGSLSSTYSIVSLIVNLLIIIIIFALLFKILTYTNLVQESPMLKLFFTTLFYIPTIFISMIDFIISTYTREKSITKKHELILLALVILLFILYFSLPLFENRIVLQGGRQLINEPIYINTHTSIASYQDLYDIPDPKTSNDTSNITTKNSISKYGYAMSFWLYIDSSSPSKSVAYNKFTPILDFGDKLIITYNSSINTLMVSVKQIGTNTSRPHRPHRQTNTPTTLQLDDAGNRIIYKNSNILLQKWNNIIINYNGGTMDLFLNGKLVNSSVGVLPYIKMDQLYVGSTDGINGAICNFVWFKQIIDLSKIYYIYNSVKDKSPPTLYTNQQAYIIRKV